MMRTPRTRASAVKQVSATSTSIIWLRKTWKGFTARRKAAASPAAVPPARRPSANTEATVPSANRTAIPRPRSTIAVGSVT